MRKLLRRAPEEDTHMAAPSLYPDANSDTGDDTDVDPARESAPSTPRWVKMFGLIFIVLLLLFVILHLAGGGFRSHMPGGHTPPASIMEHGVQQP